MSSTVPALPPPNSSSVMSRIPRLTAQARAMLTELNLHFAGIAALAVVVLYLLVHFFVVWGSLKSHDAEALAGEKAQYRAAEIAAQPLRGLDSKVVKSTADADSFYADRLPYAYSQVASELGVLSKKAGVRLTRVQYGQQPALTGKNDALTEVKMDASISGDYRPVVQFLNSLERDHMFFVIGGINITGQQTGQVNLRIRLTTYLRQPNVEESTKELPETTDKPEVKKSAGGAR
ncbi:MAG: GspMb/PilO family protein [Acidobacteriaceae bacterium]|nr:GspMb/PilO family protein [Acidobacteriaceae bacterium]